MKNKILYHYTSLENLSKIIQSKKLWLSSPYYQNDKEEMHHGLRLLDMELDNFKTNKENQKDNLEYMKMIAKGRFDSPMGVYTFSLSYEGDLLSQWRGYTKINEGVCIGFNKKNLEKRAAENDSELKDCFYDGETASEQVRLCIKETINSSEIGELEYDDKAFYVSAKITGAALQLKNSAFREEREARLIKYDKGFPSKKNEKYRITPKYVIPYTEFDISNLNGDGSVFEQVILGPHEYQSIALKSFADYLGSEHVTRSIKNSVIPLR